MGGGTVLAIGAGEARAIAPGARRTINARHLMAMPGLVNAHVHSNEAFERGLHGTVSLEPWLARAYPPLGAPAVPLRWHYLRALLVACDAIHSGTIAIQDDCLNPGCDPDALDQVMQAWADSGLRAAVATTLADRSYLDGLPFARQICPPQLRAQLDARTPLSIDHQADFFTQAHQRWNAAANGRLQVILGPRGPQRCSDTLMRRLVQLRERHDAAIHMHVLESRLQLAASNVQACGGHAEGGFLQRLQRAGLLDSRLTINHAVWLGERDIERLAASGACVTHNPLSNLRLGSGRAPLRALLEAGVPVALGSDGPATGDTADMLAVLRATSLIHRDPQVPRTRWIGPDDAWHAATRGGARSMRLGPQHGQLVVGAPADLILVDTRHRAFVPMNDPIAQLAWSASPEVIDTVIVAGSVLMHERRIEAFDETAVLTEAQAAAQAWRELHLPGQMASGAAFDPLLSEVIARASAHANPVATL